VFSSSAVAQTPAPTLSAAEKEQWEKQVAETTDKLNKDAKDGDAYVSRSNAYLHLGLYKEAFADADTAMKLKPDSEFAFCNRGEALYQLGKPDDALKDLNEALRIDPEERESLWYRGAAYEKLGQKELAAADFKKAKELGFTPGHEINDDFAPYVKALQSKIKKAWKPPRADVSNKTVAKFKVRRSGELFDLKLMNPSGDAQVDEAARQAIQSAAPFARLPRGAPRYVEVEFSFAYNVLGEGEK